MAKGNKNKNKPENENLESFENPETDVATEMIAPVEAPEAPVEVTEVVPSAPVLSPDDPLAVLQNARQSAERERNEVLAQIAKLDQESAALLARLATIDAALGVSSKGVGKRAASGKLGEDAQTILGKMIAGQVYSYKDLGGMIASITPYPYHAISQLVSSGKVVKTGRSQYSLSANQA